MRAVSTDCANADDAASAAPAATDKAKQFLMCIPSVFLRWSLRCPARRCVAPRAENFDVFSKNVKARPNPNKRPGLRRPKDAAILIFEIDPLGEVAVIA